MQTAQELPYPKKTWKSLDELDAGVCDGMTYEEIEVRKHLPWNLEMMVYVCSTRTRKTLPTVMRTSSIIDIAVRDVSFPVGNGWIVEKTLMMQGANRTETLLSDLSQWSWNSNDRRMFSSWDTR
jgi:hypothetical protein